MKRRRPSAFDDVRRFGLTLPDVEAATRYDGSPVLKLVEERESFIEDAPETCYLTEYYRRYPLVLVRLERIGQAALRELLASSRRLTLPKTRLRRRRLLS